MDSETKQERSRTRWTASIDKIFVDLIVKQIQLGNRPNNVFDKKTWGHIRDEFNTQSGLDFNTNQLRKHYDVLRIRYNNIKSAIDQKNFSIEDSCTIGFDLWESLGVCFFFFISCILLLVHLSHLFKFIIFFYCRCKLGPNRLRLRSAPFSSNYA